MKPYLYYGQIDETRPTERKIRALRIERVKCWGRWETACTLNSMFVPLEFLADLSSPSLVVHSSGTVIFW